MTVPANRSGEKLIRDYLARVTEAGQYYLPKGDRAVFVGRTRARIMREAGEAGLNDPGRIMAVLAALGEPQELVRQERARIDPGWAARQAGSAQAGSAQAGKAAPGAGARPSVSAPREHRRLNSRWRPAATTQPLSQRPAPRSASEPSRRQRGGQSPTEPVPAPPASVPGAAEPPRFPGWPEFTRRIWQLARSHLLETAAVVLLGFGGLIFPIVPPVWLLGSLLALPSRVWDERDKWVAVVGPLSVAAVLTVVIAAIMGGRGNVAEIYGHAFRMDLGYVVRVGCAVCGVYLAWRVYKGPRVKVPPWRR